MADEVKLQGAPLSAYSPEDRAFFKFWYGHILDDLMQPPLCGIDHSTARYIWDAARRAAPSPLVAQGMIRPLPGEQVQVERRRFPESGTE